MHAGYVVAVVTAIGTLLLLVVGSVGCAFDATTTSDRAGYAVLGAVSLGFAALILDGALARARLADQSALAAVDRPTDAVVPSVETRSLVGDDLSDEITEVPRMTDEQPDELEATTLRLRPLSP